jgi:hypothetical protein
VSGVSGVTVRLLRIRVHDLRHVHAARFMLAGGNV